MNLLMAQNVNLRPNKTIFHCSFISQPQGPLRFPLSISSEFLPRIFRRNPKPQARASQIELISCVCHISSEYLRLSVVLVVWVRLLQLLR